MHGYRLLCQASELTQVAAEGQIFVVSVSLVLFETGPSGVGRGTLVTGELCLCEPLVLVEPHPVLCHRVHADIE